MTLDEFAGVIDGKPKRGGYEGFPAIVGRCPACAADNRDRDGEHLLAWSDGEWLKFCRCVKGHTEEEILFALGWTLDDRRIDGGQKVKPRPVEKSAPVAAAEPLRFVPPPGLAADLFEDEGKTWAYPNPKGKPVLFKQKRYEWRQPRAATRTVPAADARWKKVFTQWCPDKRQPADVGGKILYNLPDVLAAVQDGRPIYINEGEKGCDAFEPFPDVVATCQNVGAGDGADLSGKWTPHHTNLLTGAESVFIVADLDAPGEAYARFVFRQLKPVVKSVHVVRSKADGPSYDAHDHLKRAGFKPSDFVPAPDLEESDGMDWLEEFASLGASSLKGVESVDVPWLWYPYLPIGRPILLDGDGDVGKSFMTVAIASGVLRGHKPDGKPIPGGPGRVLILASEDRADDTIVPRLEQFGVTEEMKSRVVHVSKLFKFDKTGLDKLERMVAAFKPTLVIIDPLLAYLGATVNVNASNEVRPILDGLSVIMDKHGAACILIRHTGKPGKKGERPVHHMGIGSVDIRNALRAQLVVQWHPTIAGLRVITHEKHNLSEQGAPFGYEFREGSFMWVWNAKLPEQTPALDLEINRAKDFLERLCTGSLVRAAFVVEEGKKQGISERTLKRAKAAAGVIVKPIGQGDGRWHWTIPAAHDDPYGTP